MRLCSTIQYCSVLSWHLSGRIIALPSSLVWRTPPAHGVWSYQRINAVIDRVWCLGYCSQDTITFEKLCVSVRHCRQWIVQQSCLILGLCSAHVLPPPRHNSQRYNLRHRVLSLHLPSWTRLSPHRNTRGLIWSHRPLSSTFIVTFTNNWSFFSICVTLSLESTYSPRTSYQSVHHTLIFLSLALYISFYKLMQQLSIVIIHNSIAK